MKKSFLSLFIFFAVIPIVQAADQDATNVNLQQAKSNYRTYLQQLKTLSAQYKQITSEVSKVIQEEGLPVWDDSGMGGIKIADVTVQEADSQTFGDTDIQEADKHVVVKVDLPGVKKEDLKVSILENNVLKISGHREEEKASNFASSNTKYFRSERRQGSFERQIKMPVPVSNAGTEAKYDNGVLTIKVLKVSANPVEVPVQVR